MTKVDQEQWAEHCARWATYSREVLFNSGESFLETFISEREPPPGCEQGKPHALVGRVEYHPDGSRTYYIF